MFIDCFNRVGENITPPIILNTQTLYNNVKLFQFLTFYSWTLLIRSPKGKGKWFELTR